MENNMIKKYIFMLLVIFLSSCGTIGSKKIIELNKTDLNNKTESEIVYFYGQPYDTWFDQNKNKIVEYRYQKSNYNIISYLPIMGFFSRFNTDNYITIISYNSDNKVVDQYNLNKKLKLKFY